MLPLRRGVPSLVIVLLLAVLTGHCYGNRVARQSVFPGNRPSCAAGTTCISLRSCPTLLALLQSPTINNLRRLQRALCGFNRRDPRVCCPSTGPTQPPPPPPTPTQPTPPPPTPTQPTPPPPTPTQPTPPPPTPTQPTPPPPTPTQPTPPPPTPTQPTQPGNGASLPSRCGEPAFIQTRIFFGQDAPLGAFPWMALLGFSSGGSSNVVWGCGGALINSRYVVTAAHCTSSQFTFDRRLSTIRLGEHNIATSEDCENRAGGRVCAPDHQDFTPEEIIRHPDFNSRATVSDDIALIRLDRDAQINGFVMPICLPAPGATVPNIVGSRQAQVAGWGATENGPDTQILQVVRLPFVSRARCNPFYRNGLIEEQICFGGDGRRDSCFGDSGGPVMITGPNSARYTFLALVSFGQPRCGVEGTPAVYTDIAAYRSWIVGNLRA